MLQDRTVTQIDPKAGTATSDLILMNCGCNNTASCARCGHVLESDAHRAAGSHRRIKWIAGAIIFLLTVSASADVVGFSPIEAATPRPDSLPDSPAGDLSPCFGRPIPPLMTPPPDFGLLPRRSHQQDESPLLAPPRTGEFDATPRADALGDATADFTSGGIALMIRRARNIEDREPPIVPPHGATLPEPTTLLLIGMGSALLLRRRRQ